MKVELFSKFALRYDLMRGKYVSIWHLAFWPHTYGSLTYETYSNVSQNFVLWSDFCRSEICIFCWRSCTCIIVFKTSGWLQDEYYTKSVLWYLKRLQIPPSTTPHWRAFIFAILKKKNSNFHSSKRNNALY